MSIAFTPLLLALYCADMPEINIPVKIVVQTILVLVLIPLSKVRHCLLLPFTQVVSEVAWHFTPDAGSKVGKALGKEGQPI